MITLAMIQELIQFFKTEKKCNDLEWEVMQHCPAVMDGLITSGPSCRARCTGCQFNVKELQEKI